MPEPRLPLDTAASAEPADLLGVVQPLWRRKWWILVLLVAATAATYAYFDHKPDEYRAKTSVFVRNSTVTDLLQGATSNTDGSDRSTQNAANVISSRAVAARVARKIGYRGEPTDLLANLRVTAESGADFVGIEVTDRSAARSARIANAYAEAYEELTSDGTRAQARRAIAVAQRQLAAIARTEATRDERSEVQQRIRELQTIVSTPGSSIQQVNPAMVPTRPSAPRPLRNALFALALALFVALVIVFTLERFDRRIKRAEDLSGLYRTPLLAVVPHTSSDPRHPESDVVAIPQEFLESFRALRTAIGLQFPDRPPSRILVTSAVPSEGKSTVARFLAVVYREWGLRVALVESDLRRPSLAHALGVSAPCGLTNVIFGEVGIHQALLEVQVKVKGVRSTDRLRATSILRVQAGGGDEETDVGTIDALAAGAPPPNPAVVLASDGMRLVLDQLERSHDIVIVDTPPLVAVTDAVPLLAQVDGVVLVSRVNSTTRDDADRLLDLLGRVPDVNVLGVVANDTERLALGYGYGYGGAYASAAQ